MLKLCKTCGKRVALLGEDECSKCMRTPAWKEITERLEANRNKRELDRLEKLNLEVNLENLETRRG